MIKIIGHPITIVIKLTAYRIDNGIDGRIWALIKIIWVFMRDELPQFLSNWRTVPRIMMGLYGLVFYNTMQWFMALENPNNAQAGFVSVVVGAGAAWFGLYVNGKKTDIKK